VVVLVRELYPVAPTLVGALVALLLLGVVPAEQAFAGLSSSATLTVAGLFIVARAVRDHAGLERGVTRLLAGAGSDTSALARLTVPVAAASAVIANTPLVATLAPITRTWAERNGRATSKLLMPLSFAAILGGTVTTIGTSTTLVVSGLVETALGEPFTFLEVTPVGVPVALFGLAALVALGPRLLPDRRGVYAQVATHERDYTFRLEVIPGGPHDGRSIGEAHLRNLENTYLAAVEREDRRLAPVGPDLVLHAGDVLTFVGRVDRVRGLVDGEALAFAEETQADLLHGDQHGLHEVVVGASSVLAGRTLKDTSFRGRYGAAVLAIHRAGARVEGKLGAVPLQAGDALLVLADDSFADRWQGRSDFAVLVPLEDAGERSGRRRGLVLLTVTGMVFAAAFGLTSTLLAVLGAVVVLMATRTLTLSDARGALDLEVLTMIAAAIGLGAAVAASGLAEVLATAIAGAGEAGGPLVAVLAIVVGTILLTEMVTNVAAAALMVPIALDVAGRVDLDPRLLAVAVAVAASSSFLTPIGYQTNTIVYGLGGYRFTDYWRLGLPLTVIVITAITVVTLR
ncbi:MAG: SLC13 family permease, partial [Actinobacteria bacterium]|nr:SLC13 family permease [Actinomycetota bacterium]